MFEFHGSDVAEDAVIDQAGRVVKTDMNTDITDHEIGFPLIDITLTTDTDADNFERTVFSLNGAMAHDGRDRILGWILVVVVTS